MSPYRKEVIGHCTLILGDCLEIMPTLEAESIDMIWTDPPYGNSNNDGDLNARLAKKRGGAEAIAILNDDPEGFRRVMDGMLKEAERVMKLDSCCCCCCCGGGGGPRPTFAWVANRMDTDGLQFFHSVIWDKINPGLGWRYRRQHEMVMVSHRKGGKIAWADPNKAVPNIYSESAPQNRCHPNEKPVKMVKQFINNHTTEGQTVLDPFMGSGTTGVACAQMGRTFIGIELEQKYFDIACKRIEQAYNQPCMFTPQPTKTVQEQLI